MSELQVAMAQPMSRLEQPSADAAAAPLVITTPTVAAPGAAPGAADIAAPVAADVASPAAPAAPAALDAPAAVYQLLAELLRAPASAAWLRCRRAPSKESMWRPRSARRTT